MRKLPQLTSYPTKEEKSSPLFLKYKRSFLKEKKKRKKKKRKRVNDDREIVHF
jgi:hypothetical protein